MKTIQFIILFVMIILFPTEGNTQNNESVLEKKYSVNQLQEDFEVLRRNIESYQPGLYKYSTKEELDLAFDQVNNAIDRPMTAMEFLNLTMPLQKTIANGHTQFIASDTYYQAARKKFKRLPLHVYWDQGNLYVWRNLSNNADIPQGVIIKSINGESATELFQSMADLITRDGYNTSMPEANISDRFTFYYNQTKGHPEVYTMETVEEENADPKTWTFEGLTTEEIVKIRKDRYGPPTPLYYDLKAPGASLKINGNIATMTLHTFDKKYLHKYGDKTKKFYKNAFEKIEASGVEHLIIDMRDNGGGDPEPTIQLFSHLSDQPSTFYKEITSNVKKLPKHENYSNFGFLEKNLHGVLFKKEGDTYFCRKSIVPGLKPYKPAKTQFKGQVYVLTNAHSFSATGEMSGKIKNHGKAIFIGEETGGNPVQNVSGVMGILELPNTKNRAVIPFWLWIMNVELDNQGRGVIPDHPVRPSIQDKIDGTDRVMKYTLDLIKNK